MSDVIYPNGLKSKFGITAAIINHLCGKGQVQAHIVERTLLLCAALFLAIYALILTLSPLVRFQGEQIPFASLRWEHWLGYLVWGVVYALLHRQLSKQLNNREPLLLPIIAMLNGWGLLTIYRLYPSLGDRQSLWLIIAASLFLIGVSIPKLLDILQHITFYLLLLAMGLTALTFLTGTHPLGYGPNLWLVLSGFYLQPSEIIKLAIVLYLALGFAVFPSIKLTNNSSTKLSSWTKRLHTPPAMLIICLSTIFILFAQRDLGALIVIGVLMVMLTYLANGHQRTIGIYILLFITIVCVGYYTLDIIHIRLESWLNPWQDPSGRSYQVIQSLIAIANGGILGRGAGLGNPILIPISFSDFIYAAIIEENGLLGGIGIVLLFILFTQRGIRIALHAATPFHMFTAAGATLLITVQCVFIMAGNLRILPLTGVTLPFISYGGSSLVISFIFLLLLFKIHAEEIKSQTLNSIHKRLNHLSLVILIGFGIIALSCIWWGWYRAPTLLARSDNARRVLAHSFVKRGALLARNFEPLHSSTLTVQNKTRHYQRYFRYAPLSPVLGYIHPNYGLSGLEANLDEVLNGNISSNKWTQQRQRILYGLPPPGNDVQLSIDMDIQRKVDAMFNGHHGTLVLLDSDKGDILCMSSHPFFDPNRLSNADGSANQTYWTALTLVEDAPLLNRAVQGQYHITFEQIPTEMRSLLYQPKGQYFSPTISTQALRMALTAAAISNGGKAPTPKIVLAYRHPTYGWVNPPSSIAYPWNDMAAMTNPFSTNSVYRFTQQFTQKENAYWAIWGIATNNIPRLSWYMGATINKRKPAYALAIILEEDNLPFIQNIAKELFE